MLCAWSAGSIGNTQRRGMSSTSGQDAPPCVMQASQGAQQPAQPHGASPERAAAPCGSLLQSLVPAQAHTASPPRPAFRMDEPGDEAQAKTLAGAAAELRAGSPQCPAYHVEEPDDEPGIAAHAGSTPAAPACVISTTTITRHACPMSNCIAEASLQWIFCPLAQAVQHAQSHRTMSVHVPERTGVCSCCLLDSHSARFQTACCHLDAAALLPCNHLKLH